MTTLLLYGGSMRDKKASSITVDVKGMKEVKETLTIIRRLVKDERIDSDIRNEYKEEFSKIFNK